MYVKYDNNQLIPYQIQVMVKYLKEHLKIYQELF